MHELTHEMEQKWNEAKRQLAAIKAEAGDEIDDQVQEAEEALNNFQETLERYRESAEDSDIAYELRETWRDVQEALDLRDVDM